MSELDLGALAEAQHIRLLENELTGRGWHRTVNPLGEIELTNPSGDWRVQLDAFGYWALGKFTDADVETEWGLEAQGRYRTIDEGESLDDLKKALEVIR